MAAVAARHGCRPFASAVSPRRLSRNARVWRDRHGWGTGGVSAAFLTCEMSRPASRRPAAAVAWPLLIAPAAMDEQKIEILTVRQARRLFTDGDIKSEVAFQHDVNRLLASLEDLCDSATESRSAPASSSPGGTTS